MELCLKSSMKRVIVTGGPDFMGGHLYEMLLGTGHFVNVLIICLLVIEKIFQTA
jgi:hypothetical protein